MNSEHLKNYIIIPTLKKIGLYSPAAVNLLLGTAAQESGMGYYLHQIGGIALGIYQIEPNTHKDIFENYFPSENVVENFESNNEDEISSLEKRIFLYKKIKELFLDSISEEENLIGNLYYSTAIARIIYYRIPEELPISTDINGLAKYYKTYYNTNLGKATIEEFIENYKKYVE